MNVSIKLHTREVERWRGEMVHDQDVGEGWNSGRLPASVGASEGAVNNLELHINTRQYLLLLATRRTIATRDIATISSFP